MSFETIDATVQVLWRYDYESNIKPLRDLYEVAKKEQWNAATDIPWEIKTDPAAVGALIPSANEKMERVDILVNNAGIEVVPDMDAKLYASTQVIDEARHVEVFHRYIQRLDRVYPIMHGLKALLNAVLQADLWQMKCVGMQVIAESIAMGGFKTMAKLTHDEVFRRVVELTAQDEARHVSYGLIYMKDEIPKMNERDRDRLEDFAWTAMTLLATTPQLREGQKGVDPMAVIYEGLGIDMVKAQSEMLSKMSEPEFVKAQPNPFRDYAYPQLQRIGLITDRTLSKYQAVGLAA